MLDFLSKAMNLLCNFFTSDIGLKSQAMIGYFFYLFTDLKRKGTKKFPLLAFQSCCFLEQASGLQYLDRWSVLLVQEGDGIGSDLLDHGKQSVASGWGEVITKADGLDKVEVGIKYILGRGAVEHAHEHRDDALDDDIIAVSLQAHLSVDAVGL